MLNHGDAAELNGDTTGVGSQITTSGPYNESLKPIGRVDRSSSDYTPHMPPTLMLIPPKYIVIPLKSLLKLAVKLQ